MIKPLHLDFTITETRRGHLTVAGANAVSQAYAAPHIAGIDRKLAEYVADLGGRLPVRDDVASRALTAVTSALVDAGVIRSNEDICGLGWHAASPPFSGTVTTIVFQGK